MRKRQVARHHLLVARDLVNLVHRLDRPPRRPRGPRRRRIRFSIQLDSTEMRILDAEAQRLGLATGAAIREFALTEALRSRLQREIDE